MTGMSPRRHEPMAQANFFFKVQKTTAETNTIPQAEPISINARNRVRLNV
jgi:hypothetical protein